MAEPRRWYVVCSVQPWSGLEVTAHLGAWKHSDTLKPSGDPAEPMGYMAVFDTRETAEKWGDGAPVVEMIAAQAEREEQDAVSGE